MCKKSITYWGLRKIAGILTIGLAITHSTWASDIACEPVSRSLSARCESPAAAGPECEAKNDTRPQAVRLICDYAMLSMGYERIYADQQRLLQVGSISESDVAAWREKRDSCDSVSCLDTVFAEWQQSSARLKSRPISHQSTDSGVASPSRELAGRQGFPRASSVSNSEPPAAPEQNPRGSIYTTPGSAEAEKRVEAQPPTQADIPPATAPDNAPKKPSSPLGALILFGALCFGVARVLTPKRDRRFKTGYKENRTVPTAVPILYGLSVVLVLIGFLAG